MTQAMKQRKYVIAFDHIDPGSEIERHLERARDIRAAYYRELMLRMWRGATRWLREYGKSLNGIAVRDRHRAGH
jgi:hypothetical protein